MKNDKQGRGCRRIDSYHIQTNQQITARINEKKIQQCNDLSLRMTLIENGSLIAAPGTLGYIDEAERKLAIAFVMMDSTPAQPLVQQSYESRYDRWRISARMPADEVIKLI
jgi:hypothetical protein